MTAAQVGIYILPGTDQVSNPSIGLTFVIDTQAQQVKAYVATNVWQTVTPPPSNFAADRIPTSTDDSSAGYQIGSLWVIPGTGSAYTCSDPTSSNAVWIPIASGGGGGGGGGGGAEPTGNHKTASFTAIPNSRYYIAPASAVAILLPDAVANFNEFIELFITNDSFDVTFNTTSSQTVLTQASGELVVTTSNGYLRLVSDGFNWVGTMSFQ